MKRLGIALLGCCFVIGSILVSGCGNPGETTNGTSKSDGENGNTDTETVAANTELRGDIKIDGSSTVYPISEAAAAAFKKRFPNVNTTVGKSGTGGGFKRFQKGETDVSDASRPIKDKEFKACKENNVSFVELPVAYDGLTVVVHKDNKFVESLTIDDLKNIFLADKKAMTWKAVNDAWPDEKIQIYAPGTDSGTFDYFKEVVAGKEGAIRDDMTTSENDDVLVNGVSGGEYSIGFFGASYYFQNEDTLKSVKIVNPESGVAVAPTAKTIEDGTYAPFSRPLFIYINKESISKPQVEQFVQFYLEKAAEFAEKVDYVALPKSVYESAKTNFVEENVGTHYLNESMEKRSGPITEVYQPKNLTK